MDKETKNQNKIALAVFFIVTFLSIIALTYQVDVLPSFIRTLASIFFAIPCLGFFFYLILMPLTYKSREPNVFRTINPFTETTITEEFVNFWFNLAADFLPVSLSNVLTIGIFTALLTQSQQFLDFYKSLSEDSQALLLLFILFGPGIILVVLVKQLNRKTSRSLKS